MDIEKVISELLKSGFNIIQSNNIITLRRTRSGPNVIFEIPPITSKSLEVCELDLPGNYVKITRGCQSRNIELLGNNFIYLDCSLDSSTIAKEIVKIYRTTLLSSDGFYKEYANLVFYGLCRIFQSSNFSFGSFIDYVKVINTDSSIKQVEVNISLLAVGTIGIKVIKYNTGRVYLKNSFRLGNRYEIPNSTSLTVVDTSTYENYLFDNNLQIDITEATNLHSILLNVINRDLTEMAYIVGGSSIEYSSNHLCSINNLIQYLEKKW